MQKNACDQIDTKDWCNDCWKFSFTISEINDILKYITIEKISYYFYCIFNQKPKLSLWWA